MTGTTHRELRERFLSFFEQHSHKRLPSAGLIPQSDPTLLFVNAGMVPFKRYFLGADTPPAPRVTSAQKCVRAGGKHNDLENVGYTARHHTFFEMLGNFSFGDYFKKDAIAFGWQFLTEEIGLDPDRLWITVYHEDHDARALWLDEIGVSSERILDGDEADNFWSMGDTGPCGPCSEIHYDQGAADHWDCPDPDACNVFCECDRYLEVWNLVFMQYDRGADGAMTALPNPSIDTGMGLERLAAVVQGVTSNYDTDLFVPLLQHIGALFGRSYGEDSDADVAMRVLADHSRAASFLIADGVLPSNEGRGYVLRRIMRRAIRYARNLGSRDLVLPSICGAVVKQMGDVYPELNSQAETIRHVVQLEEERFGVTLHRGLQLFEQAVAALNDSETLPGEVIFQLYDTYGFPVDLTELLAREKGVGVDLQGFEAAMADQRRRARAEQAAEEEQTVHPLADNDSTEFVGYRHLQSDSPIVALAVDHQPVAQIQADQVGELVLEKTPFYAESGGQVGDHGRIIGPAGEAAVTGVKKVGHGVWVHRISVERGTLSVDEPVHAEVDPVWRRRTAAHHTATHMLQSALREVLGTHVRQSGSLVEPQRLRFDFSHYDALKPEERVAVEARVNEKIRENLPVLTQEMAYDDAIEHGALAFFGDKYGSRVRVVEIPGFSVELCGGTHVHQTGEIGLWMLEQEGGVAAGVRRIEARAGSVAYQHLRALQDELDTAAEKLGVPRRDFIRRLDQLVETVEMQSKQLESLQAKVASQRAQDLAEAVEEIEGIPVVAQQVAAPDMDALKQTADQIRQQHQEAVIFLVSEQGERPTLFVSVPDVHAKRVPAGDALKSAAAAMNARGGGRPTSAQGGGGDPDRIPAALDAFRAAVRELLTA